MTFKIGKTSASIAHQTSLWFRYTQSNNVKGRKLAPRFIQNVRELPKRHNPMWSSQTSTWPFIVLILYRHYDILEITIPVSTAISSTKLHKNPNHPFVSSHDTGLFTNDSLYHEWPHFHQTNHLIYSKHNKRGKSLSSYRECGGMVTQTCS